MSEEVLKQYDKLVRFLKGRKGVMVDIFPSRGLPFLNNETGEPHHVLLIDQGLLVSKELYNYMKQQDVN